MYKQSPWRRHGMCVLSLPQAPAVQPWLLGPAKSSCHAPPPYLVKLWLRNISSMRCVRSQPGQITFSQQLHMRSVKACGLFFLHGQDAEGLHAPPSQVDCLRRACPKTFQPPDLLSLHQDA
mmetsp:Transcript_3702/g.4708  ORF Transcript_3702/g.4708 Transcript_3702/m.4708 type:complete len:121 (-) Transcript_3702:175-537(-)